jgi:hypothetical protein
VIYSAPISSAASVVYMIQLGKEDTMDAKCLGKEGMPGWERRMGKEGSENGTDAATKTEGSGPCS